MEILTFVLGCLFGWFTNHWYSVVMRRPNLRLTGGGGGSSFHASGYPFINLAIHNELRLLGVQLPETVILGKPLKTSFGRYKVEREPARQCKARLLEKSGRQICPLWWFDGQTISHSIEIKSGVSANLILFLRNNDNSSQYFAYQPHSNTDLSPKTTDVPKFDKTMAFLVEVSYSHDSQKLRFPVKVTIGYDGRFSYETPSSGGGF